MHALSRLLCFDLSRKTRYSVVAENTEYRVSCDIPIPSMYILDTYMVEHIDMYMYSASHGHGPRIRSAQADFEFLCVRHLHGSDLVHDHGLGWIYHAPVQYTMPIHPRCML